MKPHVGFFRMAAVWTAVLSGGVSGSAAAPALTIGIDGKSIVLVRRPDPGFLYMTSGGAAAGAFAALGPLHDMRAGHEMEDAGRQLTANDQIDDPAVSLGSVLMSGLISTY